ncbi:MAG: hypothetical protein WC421_11180 [Elusimicrobiales bacterium]
MAQHFSNLLIDVLNLFTTPLYDVWRSFLSAAPNIIAALIFLIAGLVLARLLSALTGRILHKAHLDEITSHIGVNEIFARAGFGKSPAYVAGFVIYWSVLAVFLMLAAKSLNLSAISGLLQQFAVFVPRLVVAVVILFIGMLFAPLAYRVVANSAATNNIKGGVTLAKSVEAGVLFFAALTALEQLGVEMRFIISTVQILTASVGLAFAIAFGLGAKSLAEEFLRGFFKRQD